MRLYAAVAALTGWFALILQLVIMLVNRPDGVSLWNEAIRFMSFFTILTNLLVAAVCTAVALGWAKRWICSASVQASAVVYISIVGIVYHAVLARLWNPQGSQLAVDILLHTVMPLAYVVFWFLFGPREGLEWKNARAWLAYPGAYLIYSLARGAVTNIYPYPFINAGALGYGRVILNALGFLLLFRGMGLGVIALGRRVRPVYRKT